MDNAWVKLGDVLDALAAVDAQHRATEQAHDQAAELAVSDRAGAPLTGPGERAD